MHVHYKLNETLWNVLQKEDEHRADTKYDALITNSHIWALKTTQNEFKWQHYVYKQSDVSHFWIGRLGDVGVQLRRPGTVHARAAGATS